MYPSTIQKDYYENQMNALRQMVHIVHSIKYSETYSRGLRVERYRNLFRGNIPKKIVNYAKDKLDREKLKNKVSPIPKRKKNVEEPNYFSKYRIAVYTCVFGQYDKIHQPISLPDNVDYYIITDICNKDFGVWKKVDISKFSNQIKDFSNVEKNRWFKMHAHLVFGKDYRYSLYIDGNVLPVTDFTEFANRIGEPGIAMFWHRYNNCVYQEAMYNIYDIKKTNENEIYKQIEYLKEMGMPSDYGMTTCNVIARDHSNLVCVKLMEDWWQEFMLNCRRDQLSFPYVAWKNGVSMMDIATLGNDVWYTDTLLVMDHV